VNRLALGTAQFGLKYGIANERGQVSLEESRAILDAAWQSGVKTLDTAIAYGESEERLGSIGVGGWRVVSKLPEVPADARDVAGWVERMATQSLARLGIPRLAGLLLHRPEQLHGPDGDSLFAALECIREQGLVERVGISIYDPAELAQSLGRYPIGIVQAPFNVMDRRLVTSGWLARLKARGVEVHTRSAFLQGLLLIPAARRPAWFDRWHELWARWDAWLTATGRSALDASLSFALAEPSIDRVVVGVDSVGQLREILEVRNTNSGTVPEEIQSTDLDLVNPARWRIG
jgi:aryl-alcohol dehydrogenase-like predicted oxidoreductase